MIATTVEKPLPSGALNWLSLGLVLCTTVAASRSHADIEAATPAAVPAAGVALGNAPLSVGEVAARLRTELPDLPAPAADKTNVTAYLASLAPRVLVGDAPTPAGSPIARTNRYAERFGYVRVDHVASGLGEAFTAALATLGQPSALSGLVLDLRFAGGEDFEAAADAASRFATREHAGFRLGERTYAVPARAPGAVPPVMVLVNHGTRGAAEALATAVRTVAPRSLLIGAPTAGEARLYRPIDLGGGLVARIGGDTLRMADREPVGTSGLAPDVAVPVPEADERAYLTDEFRRVSTSRSFRERSALARFNEAELVRRHRNLQTPSAAAPSAPPAVQDPALGNALDLLDGLAASAETAGAGNSR